MRKIYRYEVPVDDQVHELELRGEIVAVGCRQLAVVEFWAWHDDDAPMRPRYYVVIGTGHALDFPGRYVGTATTPGGGLVWHLIESLDPAASTPNLTAAGAALPA